MEDVAFYRDATKKGVIQNIEKHLTPGTSVVIFDSKSNKIVYWVGNEELAQSMTAEHINKITAQKIGLHEHNLKLASGEITNTLLTFGYYANWDWIIISFVDKDQLLRYSNEAMILSFVMAGILLIVIFFIVYRLSNRVSRAIIALEYGAHQLSTSDWNVKIDIPGDDEFTSLADSFNLMATEIKNTEAKLYQSISHEKNTNLSLIDSRKKYYDLVEKMTDFITIVDLDGYLLFANNAAATMFGLPAEDCVGKLFYDFVHSDDQLRSKQSFNSWLEKATSAISYENRQVDIHGQVFDVSWIIRPDFDELGKIMGFVGIGRDISESKKNLKEKVELQKQLYQAQKMEAVGQLAGGIAHDFNNMLGVIIGHAELAMMKSEPSNPLASNLKSIIDAGRRSSDLTRQLLTYARKQTISPVIIDINKSISSMLTMLRRMIDENIELKFEQSDGIAFVKIDPSQMDQIITNLCVNASDAITVFGKIVIKTESYTISDDVSNNKLPTDAFDLPTGNYVKLSVSDNGFGIDKEVIKHIFEPFYTTKDVGKGTGLGLSTIFGAVKQNNGYIEVLSELNHGTTFNIYFNSENSFSLDKNLTKPDLKCLGNEIILVVEDDDTLLDIQTSTLEQYGYKVLSANTGKHAEILAREYDGRIDLLLTDVIMPKINGKELADKLSLYCPKMKVLYMSGYTADIIANKGVICDNTHFIQKPFEGKKLATKVREVLEGQSS
jgi:two-component system cell cycle sensor histidine kinase/response regulator CckA